MIQPAFYASPSYLNQYIILNCALLSGGQYGVLTEKADAKWCEGLFYFY